MRLTGTSRPKSIFARFQPPARYSGSAARSSAVLASGRSGFGKQNMLVAWPVIFATRRAFSKEPVSALTAASAFSAQRRAASLASSTEISPPTLPVYGG
jgi:hypothetical protein